MSDKGQKILNSLADTVVEIMEKEGYFKDGCTKDPMKDRRLWRKIERASREKNEMMWEEVVHVSIVDRAGQLPS